ncbi:hypothetical protein SNK05_013605 [Fusarium graminearum]
MQRQFNQLNKKHDDRFINVVRSGKPIEISIFDVLVGDVALLAVGDIVPVDGIFIEGHGVKCDESSVTGESDLMKKTPAVDVFAAIDNSAQRRFENINLDKLDPFIISGSKIQEGSGNFLVTAVGVNSTYGRIAMSLRTSQEDTPLQRKLNGLADRIAIFGGGAALLLFIVLFIKFLAQLPSNKDSPDKKGAQFLELFVVSVTVVVVAVPEGLPLAVTLALAFATTRMMKDHNLVRILKACETMGNATTICSDKTGTLTQNKMTVVATTLGADISFGGAKSIPSSIENVADRADELSSGLSTSALIPKVSVEEFVQSLDCKVRRLLIQSNAVNSSAFEGIQDGKTAFIGSKTEGALLMFGRDELGAGPVQEERKTPSLCNKCHSTPQRSSWRRLLSCPTESSGSYAGRASEPSSTYRDF